MAVSPDTSDDTLGGMLTEVREQIVSTKKTLAKIYVDDCCKIRTKLTNIFGEATLVKLDLFHAIQIITKKASKSHSLFRDFISSLKLVFRDPIDKTPGPVLNYSKVFLPKGSLVTLLLKRLPTFSTCRFEQNPLRPRKFF